MNNLPLLILYLNAANFQTNLQFIKLPNPSDNQQAIIPSGSEANCLLCPVWLYVGGSLFKQLLFHYNRETGNIKWIISCASAGFFLQLTPAGCSIVFSKSEEEKSKAAIYYRSCSTLTQMKNSFKRAHDGTTTHGWQFDYFKEWDFQQTAATMSWMEPKRKAKLISSSLSIDWLFSNEFKWMPHSVL